MASVVTASSEIRFQLHCGLQLALGLLQIVIQPVQAAQQQVVVDAIGLNFYDLLILFDGQLEHIVGAVATGHIS